MRASFVFESRIECNCNKLLFLCLLHTAIPKTDSQTLPGGLSETTPSNEIPRLAPNNDISGSSAFRPSFVSFPTPPSSSPYRPYGGDRGRQPGSSSVLPTRPFKPPVVPVPAQTTAPPTTTTTTTTTPPPPTTTTFATTTTTQRPTRPTYYPKPSPAQIPSRRPYYFTPSTHYGVPFRPVTQSYIPYSPPVVTPSATTTTTSTTLLPSTTTTTTGRNTNSYIHLTYRKKRLRTRERNVENEIETCFLQGSKLHGSNAQKI